jgi:hypothetical protein
MYVVGGSLDRWSGSVAAQIETPEVVLLDKIASNRTLASTYA